MRIFKSTVLQIGLLLLPVIAYSVPGEHRRFRGKDYDGIQNWTMDMPEKKLQVLGLTLARSLMPEAQSKVGPSPIVESGTGPRGDDQVCYEGNNGVLLLNFRVDFAPEDRCLTIVTLSRDKKAKEIYTPCTRNSKITDDLSITGGIHLGMRQAELEKIWGEPSKVAPDVAIYVLRRNTPEFFTDDVSIYAEFQDDKLIFVRVLREAMH